MADRWRIVVVTSDKPSWQEMSRILDGLGLENSWSSSVEECHHIFRRDLVNMVFCDERVSDGDF